MTLTQQIFMLIAWLLLVPPAAAQLAIDISEERIFARFTAYVEARFHGRLLAYLVRCPKCLAHWVCFLAAPLWLSLWSSLPTHWTLSTLIALVGSMAASRIAIKLWL